MVFSDSLPEGFTIQDEPFDEVLTIDQLGIDKLDQWAFSHTVVELCTAVKGLALERLLMMDDTDAVFYLDPDVWLLASLDNLVSEFDSHDLLLTPHLLEPETEKWEIHGKEIVTTLAHGVFNLGFAGVKKSDEGLRFARWWAQRLVYFCYDDVPLGIFTDQRWCDLAPCFFPTLKVIRDKGCNVATWNIQRRPITKGASGYLAGGEPITFYHFTGFDAGRNFDEFLLAHAKEYPDALDLWNEYGDQLEKAEHGASHLNHWSFDYFSNGEKITKAARSFYRHNEDVQQQFSSPFDVSGDSYYAYCQEHALLSDAILESGQTALALKLELDRVYKSTSWRVTQPLRWLATALGGRG